EHSLDRLDIDSMRVRQRFGRCRRHLVGPSREVVKSPARVHKREISVGNNNGRLLEVFEDPRHRSGVVRFSLELDDSSFPVRTVRPGLLLQHNWLVVLNVSSEANLGNSLLRISTRADLGLAMGCNL